MDKEILRPYDAIRPFEPDELPDAYSRLLADPQFRQVLAWLYPDTPEEGIAKAMYACHTCLDFQYRFCYPFLGRLIEKASTGLDFDTDNIDVKKRHTFVSNHRDIVLDSALLDKVLVDAGSDTTCEIAIGDNLLSLPWVKDLVRINKSFIVERALTMRQMLAASKRLSEYMHLVVGQKNDNVWIAQREGRAKDSDDRTQEAILKMMAMGGEGTVIDRLEALHIVPLAISYEYDPCDWLKAEELQCRRDNPDWKKAPGDDVFSMRTGVTGYKGHIHYHCAPCIDGWLRSLDADMPKTELFAAVARHIDSEIHRGYRLYPGNYVALDLLGGTDAHADRYTPAEKAAFEKYIATQLGRIRLERPDRPFLYNRLLTMYANPAANQEKALQVGGSQKQV